MEPKLPAPNMGPERAPVVGYEQAPGSMPGATVPERRMERGERSLEHQGEQPIGAVANGPVLPAPVIAVPSVPVPSVSAASPQTDDIPLVANDDDLIEKEWVDKAKKIIAETKDDPYRREQEVSRLQTEYLRKRYGKELGEAA